MPDLLFPFTTSIIIPTYNGEKRILNLLRALNNQSYLDFEVVIAIDGSSDNTEEIIKLFMPKFKSLNTVYQTNKGRSSIRNLGSRNANGDILIFIDDDMRPITNFVEVHLNHHKNIPDTLLTGPQLEDFDKIHADIQLHKAIRSRKWEEKFESIPSPLSMKDLHLTAANFSIQKDLYHRLGGFDERLTDIEDFDLAVRAYQNNIPVYFNKEAVGWHDDFITCKSYVKRRREYENALTDLSNLKPEIRKYLKKRTSETSFLKKLIFNVFARSFWVDLVDKEKLTFLPKKIRFKIYDLIIWGLSKYYPSRKI